MMGSTAPDRVLLGGVLVDLCERDELLATLADRLTGPPTTRALAIASANLDHIHHFGTGGASRAVIDPGAPHLQWLVLLDGAPLVRRTAALTGRTWPLLAGSDLLPGILAATEEGGASVGFLGGTPATHGILGRVLPQRYPGLKVAGMWAPSRADLADRARAAALAGEIAAAGADLLVVGLGKPRQEQWIQRYGPGSGARVLLAFGASADFLAGTVTRAPAWLRRLGVEWLYRLVREPRRLFRRYLIQGPPALRLLRTDSRVVAAAQVSGDMA
jgi:N-acetylglucosaminyldiphosphoundecaprenol N-acetyl-beta-D-mannosaminyltransferase